MSKVHFFTDMGSDLEQSNLQKFGPISSTEYQVTSLHSWSGSFNSRAYAVLPGIIRYQQDETNPDLLCAVLRISGSSSLKELPVKYIIYRGIRKDSLLQADGKFISSAPPNHIVGKMNPGSVVHTTDYLRLGLGITNNPSPGNDEIYIGSNEPLELLFAKQQETNNGWLVTPGLILGDFDSVSFGLEIILESAWQQPTLSIVRDISPVVGHKIVIDEINSTASEIRASREAVLNYLDPVCLWSLFYRNGVDSVGGIKKKADLYNHIISLYENKHRVYLDIRNENNLSLNFYGNYGDILGIKSATTGNYTTTAYSSNSWPIHIFDPDHIDIPVNEEKTIVEVALPIGDNELCLCFFYHASLYREEKFELFGRWPYFAKNNSRFVNIKPVDENATLTSYIKLSTYQVPNGGHPISGYFRLFYAKQYTEQTPASNASLIGSKHILDNLFNIVPLNTLLALKDSLGMKNFLDGNKRYIDRVVSDGAGLRIQYSGMYQTGVAVDEDNITLFAVPFATRENKRLTRVKLPLPGLNSGGFMTALASGAKSDIGIEKIMVYGAESTSLLLLNIYSNPKAGSSNNFDPDAFLGLTMTRDEYETISSELSNYSTSLHPVYIQVQSDLEQLSQIASEPYRKAELQLAGYSTIGERLLIDMSSSGYPTFYGLELNGSQYFNTDLSGSLEGSPIVENPTAITIGHNPYDSSDERKKYDEIREAIILIKSHLRDEFNEIQSLLSDVKMDIMPKFIADSGSAKYNGSREEYRKYRFEIKYDDLGVSTLPSGAVIGGQTEQERADIEIEHDSGSTTLGKSTADILKDGDDPYINKSEYETLALNNNKTPEDIAEQFVPKIKTYVSSTNDSPPISIYSEFTPITDLIDSGRAVINVNTTIKLNLVFRNHLSPFYASNDPIEVGVSDAQAQTTQKLLEGNYAGISKRHIMIASIIAHELGHALHPVSNPLSSYAWSLLEGQYDLSDNRTDPQSQIYPSFTGHGHLEGSPTGNLSANFEFKFGKSFVENGIWKEADRLIKIYGSIVNEKSDKFNFKKDIVPNHLDITTLNPNELKFEVSTYLRGNLTLLPKDLPVNIKGND